MTTTEIAALKRTELQAAACRQFGKAAATWTGRATNEELREALTLSRTKTDSGSNRPDTSEEIENELGDLLFSLVNLARFLKSNPEDALRRAINRFIDRFHLVEAQAVEKGRSLTEMTLAEMDELWDEAKQRLQRPQPNTTPHIGDHAP